MLHLWNLLDDVMRTEPWFTPFSVASNVNTSWPLTDVAETDSEYLITAELPGVPLEDVKLEIENDVLMLTAVKRQPRAEEARGFHHLERRYGTFTRAFSLPKAVDRDQVQAVMKDGILSIRLPKAEQARPRQIPVRIASLGPGESPARQITTEGSESHNG